MIYLKKINYDDIDEEYTAITNIPEEENGFENKYYNVTKDEFKNKVIPTLLNNSDGIDLEDGHVPDTYFFLWNDDKIIGLFKVRHYLNDSLRNGAGHVGFCIISGYRGNGYATNGLNLVIEECKNLILEDEIYFSVLKYNTPSLRTIQKCGGYITFETEDEYLARIKIRKN